jgi:hypothetical protein
MYLFDPSRVACGGTAGKKKKQPPQLLKLRRLNKHIE